MDVAGNRRRTSLGTVVFMVAAVVFSGLAGLLFARMMGESYSREPVRPIIVASREIAAGSQLSATDLRRAEWPRSAIPQGAFATVEELLARKAVPLVPLASGEAVLSRHLSRSEAGLGIAAKLEPGQRAVTVATDESVTLSQLLYPGARVDLLSTLKQPLGLGRMQVKTTILLQNVLVLAVGPVIDPVTATTRAVPGKAASVTSINQRRQEQERRVVTLALTPEQTERFVLARREGKIDMVLRSPSDAEDVRSSGATVAQILGDDRRVDDSAGADRGGPGAAGVGRFIEQRQPPAAVAPRRRRPPVQPKVVRPSPYEAAPAQDVRGPLILRPSD